MIFQSRLPAPKVIGVKAMPIAAKKAITQGVHPKVSSPKMKAKTGIDEEPFGSVLFNRKFICVSESIELVKRAKTLFITIWMIKIVMPTLAIMRFRLPWAKTSKKMYSMNTAENSPNQRSRLFFVFCTCQIEGSIVSHPVRFMVI